MKFDMWEPSQVGMIWGTKDGKSTTAGCTRQQFTIATSGASLASGVSSISNASFEIIACLVKCDTDVSTGVSIILDHEGGAEYDVELAYDEMEGEDFLAWYPTSRLVIPQGNAVKLRSSAPKVTGATRYHSIIVVF